MVQKITNKVQFDRALRETEKLIVVDFYAVWCGPCQRISPYFERLSMKYNNVVFLQVDVDEVEAVAKAAGVTAMPTFHAYKNGAKVGELVGTNQDSLRKLIEDNM